MLSQKVFCVKWKAVHVPGSSPEGRIRLLTLQADPVQRGIIPRRVPRLRGVEL